VRNLFFILWFFYFIFTFSLFSFGNFWFIMLLFNNRSTFDLNQRGIVSKWLWDCLNWRSFKNWIKRWLCRTLISISQSRRIWSLFCHFYRRRFYKCCNFSYWLEPIWKFKKVIYSSNKIKPSRLDMIIDFILIKFLHVNDLLS